MWWQIKNCSNVHPYCLMLPLHRPKLKHNINLRDTSTDWTRYCTELRAYDQNLEFQTREGKQGNKNENNKKIR